MAGDTNPIRNLGYLSWSDDLAWMESQSGPRWDQTVNDENARFDLALKPLTKKVNRFLRSMKKKDESDNGHAWKWRGWTVEKSEFSPIHIWTKGSLHVDCWDADTSDKLFAAAIQDEKGYERFILNVFDSSRLILSIERVGPYVAFLNSTSLAYLKSEEDHRYNSLWIWKYETGQHKKIHEISDPTKNLVLVRLENGSVGLKIDDFKNESFGFVHESHVEWLDTNRGAAVILAVNKHMVLVNPVGSDFHPDLPNDYLESASKVGGWAVTRSYGLRTLWNTSSATKAKAMVYIWGEITYDTRDPTRLSVCDVRYEPYTIFIRSNKWSLTKTKPHPFICSYYNTKAPTFVVSPNTNTKAKGLLVTAYGAYGTPTKIGRLVHRWRPLLESGWAIASVGVPGSGDHDLAWRFAAQKGNRKLAIDTLCAAVRDLQEELGIPGNATVLYGRSAGGLLVAGVVSQDPSIVGALYIESPYVDVLRTLTNKKFPLSVLESNEFGNGDCPVDVISLASWSPMERIPKAGMPNIFIVARTDMTDLEVYPYEPLKYITRMRGHDSPGSQPKLIYISSEKGHFTTSHKSRAEDLALLDTWLHF